MQVKRPQVSQLSQVGGESAIEEGDTHLFPYIYLSSHILLYNFVQSTSLITKDIEEHSYNLDIYS